MIERCPALGWTVLHQEERPAVQLFDPDVHEAHRALSHGRSVRIVGARGSGRSTVLRGTIRLLERSRHPVVSVFDDGLGLAHPGYLAAQLLRSLGAAPVKEPSAIADALAQAVSADTIIAIDGLERVDAFSLRVLETVRLRRGARVLVTELPGFGQHDPDRTLSPSWPERVVRLSGLGLGDVHELASDVLDGEVDPAFAALLTAQTAGRPLLVQLLAATARDRGRLVRGDGVWRRAATTLWNEDLHHQIDGLLGSYSAPVRRLVGALGERGPLPLREAVALGGGDVLRTSEDYGLVVRSGSTGNDAVQVWPPLVADRFRHREAASAGPGAARAGLSAALLAGGLRRQRESLHQVTASIAARSPESSGRRILATLSLQDGTRPDEREWQDRLVTAAARGDAPSLRRLAQGAGEGGPDRLGPAAVAADALADLLDGDAASAAAKTDVLRDAGGSPAPLDDVVAAAYVATLAAHQLGDVHLVDRALESALLAGEPPAAYTQPYAALLQLHSLHRSDTGRSALRSALRRESHRLAPAPGPFFGTGTDVARTLLSDPDRDPGVFDAELARAGRARRERGFPLAAAQTLAAGLEVGFGPLAASEFERAVAELTAPGFDRLARLIELLVAGSVAAVRASALDGGHRPALPMADLVLAAARRGEDADRRAALLALADALGGPRMPGVWPPSAVGAAQDTVAANALTGREQEIAMLAGRFTNAQIGELLSISGRTVENHLARAMRKSGVRSRTDLYDVVSAPRGPHPRQTAPGGASPARG